MSELRLMAVHAHPDDESSKGAATLARYADEGHRVLVVTLTGGERGEILNPAMDLPDVHGRIAEIRRDEMTKAAEILGVEHTWLGFVDSGLPKGDLPPPLPDDCFARVPLEVSTEALVRVVREFRPHVMTTYDENGGYPHPDHIRCHQVSVAAYEAAGDFCRFPDAGEPWTVSKLYYVHGFLRERMQMLQDEFARHGQRGPFEQWLAYWDPDHDFLTSRVTTRGRVLEILQPTRRCVARACHPDRPERRILRRPACLAGAAVADRGIRVGSLAYPRAPTGDRIVRRDRAVNQILLSVIAEGGPGNTGPDFGKASPVGLLVIVLLVIATLFLVRSMNQQLKKVPKSFDRDHPELDQAADEGTDRDGPARPPGPPHESG